MKTINKQQIITILKNIIEGEKKEINIYNSIDDDYDNLIDYVKEIIDLDDIDLDFFRYNKYITETISELSNHNFNYSDLEDLTLPQIETCIEYQKNNFGEVFIENGIHSLCNASICYITDNTYRRALTNLIDELYAACDYIKDNFEFNEEDTGEDLIDTIMEHTENEAYGASFTNYEDYIDTFMMKEKLEEF